MTSKLCARCKQHRPAVAFRANTKLRSGLDSWCRDCHVQALREWRARNPAYAETEKVRKRSPEYRAKARLKYRAKNPTGARASYYSADPLLYSQNVCQHVANYVERASERFEKNSGMEAPPHLAALLALANSLVAQHPHLDE